MSPHEQGDTRIESERVATSGGYFSMYKGRGGVCQSRLPVFAQTLLQALDLAHPQAEQFGSSGMPEATFSPAIKNTS